MFIPAVWQLHVPPRVHVFLWLLSQNKLMTRDNLNKRKLNKPECCTFCTEDESIEHLFFQCIVAKHVWHFVSEFFSLPLGADFISIAKFWLANQKHATLNSVCASTLWCIQKFRNNMFFNCLPWINLHQILRMVLNSVKRWKIIFKDLMLPVAEEFYGHALRHLRRSFELTSG